ncbi:MAG TPA: hypothetical protein IAB64_05895 [Candidatus Coproplasma excrementavium]|nr:hypothetical protein [Candidatus Coproplasma excrementavium]
MNKINGYTQEEARAFVQYIYAGRRAGRTLSSLFEGYAQKSGRAKGSVRNYYYALLRSTGNKEVRKLLRGTDLHAQPVQAFSDEETDRVLRAILAEKSKGISVRRAVLNLAGGDDKLMLRYQNKYRNVLTKQPERIKELMQECGGGRAVRRVEKEIDGLYDRLASDLREENLRLREKVKQLTDENAALKIQVKNLQS